MKKIKANELKNNYKHLETEEYELYKKWKNSEWTIDAKQDLLNKAKQVNEW